MVASLTRVLPADPASRAASLSVLLNAVSMVLKLSVAVLSDGIDSLEDFVASGIALVSVRYGAKPPDARHPYGHGGAETIAASIQALLIGVGGVFILYNSVRRILDPPESIDTGIAIVVMLIAAGANFALVQYTSRVAKQTNSPAIASEARHLMTNVVQAAAVTLGLLVVLITDEVVFDGVIAFLLGCYLLWIAFGIIKTSAADVLSASLEPDEVASLQEMLQELVGDHHHVHELRTRRTGQVRHIDFHLTFANSTTIEQAHTRIDEVQHRIEEMWPGSVVTIHADPETEVHEDPPL